MQTIDIDYHFVTSDQCNFNYAVRLDPETGAAVNAHTSGPGWTRLEHCQCACCPLTSADTEYCPLAVQISEVVHFFGKIPSYDQLSVSTVSEQRQMSFNTDAQNGMRSLLGLIMAVSGCPKTALLRPMARFHLPLANIEETSYRVASMYMLAQYFIHMEGKKADWEMKRFKEIYGDLHTVNTTMIKRMKDAVTQDAPNNAVVILDAFAMYVTESLPFRLEELRGIFAHWVEQA